MWPGLETKFSPPIPTDPGLFERKESKVKMSLTRILSEIKLTAKKLEDFKETPMVDIKTVDQKTTVNLAMATDEAKIKLQSNFDSWKSLSKNLTTLRSALVSANAINKVKINGVEYTIAQAIDRRKNLADEETILVNQERRVSLTKLQVQQRHDQLISHFNANIVEKLKSSSNTKVNDEDIAVLRRTFVDSQEFELIDPNDISKKLEEKRKDLESFKSEVDICLTEANSKIILEVEI